MKQIKVLMIGQGFMGGITHPRGILEANYQLRPQGIEFVLDCVAGTNPDKLATTQKAYGYARTSTDYAKEIAKADLVVVTAPNKEHRPMALAALKAGKAVVCEKPLACSLEEAQDMAAAAKKAGTPTMVTFCYQGAPGALEARRLVQNGSILGKSGYFEGTSEFLQDWGRGGRSNFRFAAEQGLGGVIEDLGAHQVDLVQFILGKKVVEVSAQTRIYDGDAEDLKMVAGSDEKAKGKAVDAFDAIARFDNGSAITFRSNRTSTGHKAFFETTLHGNRGGVAWELEDQAYLKFYSHTRTDGAKVASRERGWTNIHLSDPGGDGHLNTDTVPGLINGYLQYFRWQYVQFGLQLLGKPDKAYTPPTFADACQVQAVCDAIYRSGVEDGKLTKVAKV
ncbi:MAG TPA: Gfo/Idh/MocA family oxidoreductase [Planctomycetota bacterium]|nr:Gfo/Idh/MocA family oxidoreductase [Planctomycetota bacterium]